VAWIASALTGIPYTVTTHAKDIFHESVDPVWLRRICADAQRVIAISRYNEDYLGTVLAGTGATVSLRYNALELDRFSYRAPQQVSATRAEPLRVCAVGRLVPKKGFADLVEAVRILASPGNDVAGGRFGAVRQRQPPALLGLLQRHGVGMDELAAARAEEPRVALHQAR